MKMYFTLFACLLVLYADNAEAQTVYRRNTTPTGFQINDCCIIGDSTIITVGNDGTILYSENMFRTWNKAEILVRQHLNGIVHISAGKCIAVGDDGIILLGEGNGKTWALQQTIIHDTLQDIALTGKGMLYAVGNNGCITRSTDKGITWSAEYYPELGNARKIVFHDSIGIITGTGKTLLRSEDWGNTWQKIAHPYNTIYSLCHRDNSTWFVGCDSLMVGFSEDNGTTWKSPQKILPPTFKGNFFDEIRDVAFTDEVHGYAVGIFYLNETMSLFNDIIITNDGGKTWVSNQRSFRLPSSRSIHPTFTSLSLMPDKSSVLVCGRYNTVEDPYIALYTNNSWKHVFFGEGETEFVNYHNDTADITPNFTDVQFFTLQKGIAFQHCTINYNYAELYGSIKRIVRTEDGGRIWNNSLFLIDTFRVNDYFIINSDDIIAEIVKSTDNQRVNFLYRSRDSGVTWSKDTIVLHGIKKTLNDTTAYIAKIFSVNDMYMTHIRTGGSISEVRNHVLISSNKGNDWDIFPLPKQKHEIYYAEFDIEFMSPDKGIFEVKVYDSVKQVYSRKMFITNNGGKHWQQLFEKPTEAFTAYTTERYGNSIWRAEFEDSPIDKTIPVWTKIISSGNNGETWDTLDLEKHNNTALLKNMYCSKINFIDENTGIMEMVLKSSIADRVLFITTNGDERWTLIPFNSNNGYLTYNFFDKNTVFLGARRNSLYYFDPQEIPIGIEETQTTSAIAPIHIWNAFPNPTEKGKINLMLTWLENVQPNDINFRLYTVEGIEQTHTVTVENWVKGGSGNGIVTLNLQSVPNGLYILSCESGAYKTAKIIIVDK